MQYYEGRGLDQSTALWKPRGKNNIILCLWSNKHVTSQPCNHIYTSAIPHELSIILILHMMARLRAAKELGFKSRAI